MRQFLCVIVLASVASIERACDNGWLPFKNQCYWFSSGSDIFHYAVVICSNKGSNLIELKTAEEEKWVLLQSRIRRYTHVWIGLTDVVDEGQYVYPSNGLRPRYSNWHRTEPSGGRGENCACLLTEQRLWNDYPCSSRMSYVCKKPAKHFV